MREEPAKLLTIAGSDSGGAAGLQADLKTWTALGVYGMSVVTAVTAQNSIQVSGIQTMSAELVAAQLVAVLSDYGAQGIKTGFIGHAGLIKSIAHILTEYDHFHLVVDPVLVNHLGEPMFDDNVVQAYRDFLLPLAEMVTPNWPEAALLAGLPLSSEPSSVLLDEALAALHGMGARHVLLTGHRLDRQSVDYWSDGRRLLPLPQPLIETRNVHGSGDTLSAAICAFLAQGATTAEAITKAQQFTAQALQKAATWQLGKGHGPLSHLF